MTGVDQYIKPDVPPSGPGCVECEQSGSWWLHLRRCTFCGHIGCCDDSLNTHATKHVHATGHQVICSYEPDEVWFWDYATETMFDGPTLHAPHSHPRSQTVPGPEERVPSDWQRLLGA
ncbi:UBP-type zinc finger domain-containing protein [Pseudoclavibacter sp. JSM 162008]|uniref:UBP-type zinc finger domain-containing protein n=1 Tax=Pseudoclavibacter sp. JSM 162008 TaxID=3229855 RepID=UPI0035235EAE